MKDKNKVVVGISGGVDSFASAVLLKECGYDVLGVTLITSGDNGINDDAKLAAEKAGIPYTFIDCRKDFSDKIISYFVDEYKAGRTPNPCIVCNRSIKWKYLIDAADKAGAYYISTGHYVKIERHPETGRYAVKLPEDERKEQTYVLYRLTQEQLSRTLTPAGEYDKERIRMIAKKTDEQLSEKKDSQEICFLPDGDYGKFISERTKDGFKEGDFLDVFGNKIGRHNGIANYTIGQRKGLGVAFGKPFYVSEINPDENTIILSENDSLFKKIIYADDIYFMAAESIDSEIRAEAKIRYNHKRAEASVSISNGILKCVFDKPQRAAAPGQALVVYKDGYILCGGTITAAE